MIKTLDKTLLKSLSAAEASAASMYSRSLLVILLTAAVLRLYQLGTESIWIDEHFSIIDAQDLDLGTRPLYYLLLHVWMTLGQSDAWMRALSIPFSIGCVFLTFLLGRRLLSPAVGTVSALMVAISPLFVGYGQQIRMYSLSTCLGLWGTLLLLTILQQPKGIRLTGVIGWLVARLLAILTTPLNVLLLLPDAVLILYKFRRDRRVVLGFLAAVVLVGVVWLPFAQTLIEALPRFMGGWIAYQPKPGPVRMLAMLTGVSVFWPMSDLSSLANIPPNVLSWGYEERLFVFYMTFTVLSAAVLGIGFWQVVRPSRQFVRREMSWLIAWAILPTLAIFAVSWVSGSIWKERYLMFVAPYFLLILGAGWCEVWRRYRRGAIAIAAIYGLAVSMGLGHYYTTLYHPDWKGISALIESQEQPDDVIGFYGWEWEEPMLTIPRYYQGNATFHIMKKQEIPTGENAADAEPFIQTMFQALPPNASQYWFIVYEPSSASRKKLKEAIEQTFDVQDHQIFSNSMNDGIRLYRVNSKK